MDHGLTIGMLAQRGGVHVETIRYYQRRGLLIEPVKPLVGFRRYPHDSVQRVRFIKRAQALGFTLDEILGLVQLEERKACSQTHAMAMQKLILIEKKLADLAKIKVALADLVRACDTSANGEPCPIIELLVNG